MIIKSLSRKKASYQQLLAYIAKHSAPNFTIEHNIPFDCPPELLSSYFERLAAQLPQRKNGNMLYHEILSIQREPGVDLAAQQQALYALCQQYIQCRAADHAVFGKMHIEGHHLHAHLIISPSTLERPEKRVRIPKATYAEMERQLETWLLGQFPELKQAKVFTKDGLSRSRPDKEVQFERRTGRESQKARIRLAMEHLLGQAESPEEFAALLQRYGMTFYLRGQVPGIKAEKRNYRLTTLGLADAYAQLATRPAPHIEEEKIEREPEPAQQTSQGTSSRVAELAAERLVHLLRELFQYSPSLEALVQGLETYHIELQQRPDGVWCVHEGMEAPLQYMGLLPAYTDAWQRLAPATAPEQPTLTTRQEHLEQERVRQASHDAPEQPEIAPRGRKEHHEPPQHRQPPQGHPEPPGEQMSDRLRKLNEIRQEQCERPDLDLDGPGLGR